VLQKRKLPLVMFFGGALLACGDDAPPPDIDAPPEEDVPKITDPEGGNILFEFIYLDTELQAAFGLPNGVTTINRVIAYFMESQTPNANPLPMPGVCNNLEGTKGWPLFVGSPHVDLDVGTVTITGKNLAGADVTNPVAMQPAGTDSIGRPHDKYYQVINPTAENFIKPNSSYTVAFGGSATTPATTFTDGIFMAETFTVNNPDLEGNGPMRPSQDFPVAWTPGVSSALPEGDEVLGVTWLVDAAGSPTHLCPTLHSQGAFTIPKEAIAEYRAIATARGTDPNKVILLRNAIVHRISRLPTADVANKRRIDMLSVHCWAQLMDVAGN